MDTKARKPAAKFTGKVSSIDLSDEALDRPAENASFTFSGSVAGPVTGRVAPKDEEN